MENNTAKEFAEFVTASSISKQFQPLRPDTKNLLIDILKKNSSEPYDFEITFYGLAKDDWIIHEGDLIIEKSLKNNLKIIVFGDVTIKGVYEDEGTNGNYGSLITTGNLKAEHIISESLLTVLGDVSVNGLFLDCYNDCATEVKGNVNCSAYFNMDKVSIIHGELKSEFEHDYDGFIKGPSIFEFFVDEVIEKEDGDDLLEYDLELDILLKYLYLGKPIFKR